MPEYEIRLLAPAMQPTHSVYGAYSNDDEAVLVAKRSVVVKVVEVRATAYPSSAHTPMHGQADRRSEPMSNDQIAGISGLC
jgi:hypothetical protein